MGEIVFRKWECLDWLNEKRECWCLNMITEYRKEFLSEWENMGDSFEGRERC